MTNTGFECIRDHVKICSRYHINKRSLFKSNVLMDPQSLATGRRQCRFLVAAHRRAPLHQKYHDTCVHHCPRMGLARHGRAPSATISSRYDADLHDCVATHLSSVHISLDKIMTPNSREFRKTETGRWFSTHALA